MSITTASEPLNSPEAAEGGRRTLAALGRRLRSALNQGLTPHQLAMTLALGVCLGVLPTIWGTSLLCALAAWACRLNQALIQLVNYLCFPLQILLFIPFLQFGRWLFGPGQLPLTSEAFPLGLHTAPIQTLHLLGEANLLALGGWALVAPPLAAGCYGLGLTATVAYRKVKARAKSNPIRNRS